MKRMTLLMTASLILLSGCDWFGCCKKQCSMPDAPQGQSDEGYTHREQPSDTQMGTEESVIQDGNITMYKECPNNCPTE